MNLIMGVYKFAESEYFVESAHWCDRPNEITRLPLDWLR